MHPWQQAILRTRRIRNQASGHVVVEFSQEISDQRRFSAADLAGDHGKAGAIHYAKFQHGKCQSVILAPVDQIGVRQDRKWLLAEPIKGLVHGMTCSSAGLRNY